MKPILLLAIFVLLATVVCGGAADEAGGAEKSQSCPHPKMRVAVVGAGIGGGAAASYIREADVAADWLEIVMFEKEKRHGGRMSHIRYGDKKMEIGASVYHIVNRRMVEFAKLFKQTSVKVEGGNFGIWDGDAFVFQESDWFAVNAANVVLRYGMSFQNVKAQTDALVKEFEKLYDHLDAGEGFETPAAFLASAGILNFTRMTVKEFFDDPGVGVSDTFANEVAVAVNRINYGQDNSLNAFAGLVSMVGFEPELYQIEAGNSEIPAWFSLYARADGRMNTRVTRLDRDDDGKFIVNGNTDEPFDVVIWAAPMEHSYFNGKLELRNLDDVEDILGTAREYVWTHVTVVEGVINLDYFDVAFRADLSDCIGTIEDKDIPFSSVCRWHDSEEHADDAEWGLYKVFSRQELSPEVLHDLFSDTALVHRVPISAYPRLTPETAASAPPFKLADGFYYVSAFESMVSTMETQLMAGQNVANLVLRDEFAHTCEPGSVTPDEDADPTPGHAAAAAAAAAGDKHDEL